MHHAPIKHKIILMVVSTLNEKVLKEIYGEYFDMLLKKKTLMIKFLCKHLEELFTNDICMK